MPHTASTVLVPNHFSGSLFPLNGCRSVVVQYPPGRRINGNGCAIMCATNSCCFSDSDSILMEQQHWCRDHTHETGRPSTTLRCGPVCPDVREHFKQSPPCQGDEKLSHISLCFFVNPGAELNQIHSVYKIGMNFSGEPENNHSVAVSAYLPVLFSFNNNPLIWWIEKGNLSFSECDSHNSFNHLCRK